MKTTKKILTTSLALLLLCGLVLMTASAKPPTKVTLTDPGNTSGIERVASITFEHWDTALSIKYSPVVCDGYELQISTDLFFRKNVQSRSWGKDYRGTDLGGGKISIDKKDYVSAGTIQETQYVRMRAYNEKSSGRKVYGPWSATKSVSLLPPKLTDVEYSAGRETGYLEWDDSSCFMEFEVQISKYSTFGATVFRKSTFNGDVVFSFSSSPDLIKGQTYYARVRATQTINGQDYAGPWSDTLKFKA